MLTEQNIAFSDEYDQELPVFVKNSQKILAWEDITQGLIKWRIWMTLAYQDIKLRYRRSVLGPFWLTLSMAITVYSMGFLYATLFHIALADYYPYLVTGMLIWTLISTIIMELTDGLITSEALIKQIKLPYTIHLHRIASRNIFIFFHNIVVLVPIILIFHNHIEITFATLLFIPALALLYLNTLGYGLLLSLIGARYRDISQVIKSLVQVIFFITPVMWDKSALGGKHAWLFQLNPVYGLLECLRQPLLGHVPTLHHIISACTVTAIGLILGVCIFTRYRSRIVYWL